MNHLVSWAVRSRGLVLLLVLGLVVAGVAALRSLRVEALPDLTDVQVQVLAEAPGLSPLEVERLVAFPVEVAMNGLPAVRQVRSLSRYGFASVTVVFEDGTDIYFARTLVSERLQRIAGSLPRQAEATLGPLAGAISEIYLYTLEGTGQDLLELRTIHDRLVRPQLATVPGVVEINAFGGLVRQVQVTTDPDRLAAHGLTLHDLVEAVAASSVMPAGGYLEHGDQQLILRGLTQATGPADVGQTVVRSVGGVPILVGDVATVEEGAEVRQGAVTRDGTGEVVSGIVMMRRGENSRDVIRQVRARVAEVNRSLPDGVQVVPYYDQSDLVAGTFRTVRTNLLEGGLLVLAVLLLFLGNVRAALLVAAVIPLSLLFAFVGMRWLGLSANLMSLGAIDFGLVVDGAVVMVEHFVRTLHGQPAGPGLPDRVAAAARRVARPITFGVSIILLVYLPILALQGLEGRLFRPMALTVALALLGSLLLALTFVPAAATWLFRRGASEAGYAVRLAALLDRAYTPVLRATMRHPVRAVAVAAVLLAGSLVLVSRVGTEFLPELDEGAILVQAVRDPSVSLAHAVEMQAGMERAIVELPEVTTVVSRVGRAEVGSDPMGVNLADVVVMLTPRSQWRPGLTKAALVEEIEQRLEARVPGMAYSFTQPMAMRLDELISGVRADVAIKVFGEDPLVNRDVAEQVAEAVRDVPGAAEVQVQVTQGQTYLTVRPDRAALARHGIPMTEVQEALEAAVGRRPIAQVVEGNWLVDVVVQYPEMLRQSEDALGAIRLPGRGGVRVSLAEVARIGLEGGPVQVNRERAQRLVIVQANVRGRDLGGFAADVQAAVAGGVTLPPGMFIEYGGEFENQRRAMARLRFVVPLVLGIIVLLVHASLGTWRLTGLILLNLPFAVVGGVFALWLRGLHLGISAALGVIAVLGVSTLNALVLLTTVQQLRSEGAPMSEACEQGARTRLRPVLMTALVASLGFIPAALSHGTGAEVQRPLATVVIGGLVTSTLLTLLVLPALAARVVEKK